MAIFSTYSNIFSHYYSLVFFPLILFLFSFSHFISELISCCYDWEFLVNSVRSLNSRERNRKTERNEKRIFWGVILSFHLEWSLYRSSKLIRNLCTNWQQKVTALCVGINLCELIDPSFWGVIIFYLSFIFA